MSEKKISLLNEKSLLATRIKTVEKEIEECYIDKQTDDENFTLLQLQLSAMKNYSRHLQARIELSKVSGKK